MGLILRSAFPFLRKAIFIVRFVHAIVCAHDFLVAQHTDTKKNVFKVFTFAIYTFMVRELYTCTSLILQIDTRTVCE